MITGIRDFYYNVQDMNRAVKFYTEVLSFKVVHSDEYWTTLTIDGANIGLHWTEGDAVPAVLFDGHGAFHGGTLTLSSNNIEEDKRHLENAGAKILSESKQPWGHMLVFLDLDGNVLKLMN
ncbi:MAG: VOC family protein [Bacteriovorax sp.]